MSWEQLPLFLAAAFVAEVIGTMAGFGAATILTPIAALFMDVKTAIALVACFHLFGNGSRLIFFGRHIQWAIWAQFGLTGIACSFLGARLAARLSSPVISLLFGLFLLAYVALSLRASTRLVLPRRPATLAGGGAVSGLVAGLLGTGGAIRSVALLSFDLPAGAYIGTSAAIALMVDATRLPVYLSEGLIPQALLPALGLLIGVAFTGSWTGQRLVRRISPAGFRRVVLALLALMGAKMLADGWRALG